MKNKILLISMIAFIISMSLASGFLGTFKQGNCVPIVTVLNSSYATISVLTSPSPNPQIILTNVSMVKDGDSFSYIFCNTSKQGFYTYGYSDDKGNVYSNDFEIRETSLFNLNFDTTQGIITFILLILISVAVLAFVHWEMGCIFILVTGIASLVNNNNLFIGISLIVTAIALAFIPHK